MIHTRALRTGRWRRRRGAVLIEAAAACIFLLLPLVLGIIQFGIFYGTSNSLSQVSREGGRYAAVYALTKPDSFIKDRMIETAALGKIALTPSDITISPAATGAPLNGRTRYTPIVVTVNYDLNNKRIIRLFSPGIITRTSTTMIE